MTEIKDYERITEYCFLPKQEKFVVRFLDGNAYSIAVSDLPKKLTTREPDWDLTILVNNEIVFRVNGKKRSITSKLIHAKGQLLE